METIATHMQPQAVRHEWVASDAEWGGGAKQLQRASPQSVAPCT